MPEHAAGDERDKGVCSSVHAEGGRCPVAVEGRITHKHEERAEDRVVVALLVCVWFRLIEACLGKFCF